MRFLLVQDRIKTPSYIDRSLSEKVTAIDLADGPDRALEMIASTFYNLILLGSRLPKISGTELCRQIRYSGIETPILLMLTARSTIRHKVEGLDAGADDCLAEPFAPAEFHARVRALTRRRTSKFELKISSADLQLDRLHRTVRRGQYTVSLSAKEFMILELLMTRSPLPVTRADILDHVWPFGLPGDGVPHSNILEVYINRLRRKIDSYHAAKLIHVVRGTGYRLGD